MKERKRFLLYYDWENLIKDMSDTDVASLTRWIFQYQNTGEIPEMTYWAKLAFSFMRPVFDEDRKDWEEIKKTNSDNAKKRWDKRVSEPMRPHTTVSEPMRASTDSVSVNDSVNDKDIIETLSKDTEQAPKYAIVEIEQDEESKELQKHLLEKAVEIAKETYWKEELNLMQWYLRKAVWVTQFKDSKERWYVQHCYNLLKKIWREEFEIRLKAILEDDFKSKNCNKLAYLYWEIKSYIHSPVVESKQKQKHWVF